MLDSDIVAAIGAGDTDALAAAYDRYAAPLHAFCCSLLSRPADAAGAVQDTFVIAAARLAGLRDHDGLKPWLYAVARNECHRRLHAPAAADGLDAGQVRTGAAGVGIDFERAELAEVVASVVAGLDPGEREAVELSLRHDFGSEDLASTLGISVSQADALAARACERFETSLGALLVARTGRASCARLDELLESWNGQLTEPLPKELSRHVRHCRACSGRSDRELEPALLLGVPPVMAIARRQRQQVLALALSGAADAGAYRDGVLRGAGPFAESGFPVPADPPGPGPGPGRGRRRPGLAFAAVLQPGRGPRRPAAALAAVAAVAVLGAAVLEVVQHQSHRPRPAVALGSRILSSQSRASSPHQAATTRASSAAARHAAGPALAIATPTVPVPVPVSAAVTPSATTPGGPTSTPTVRPSPPPSSSGTPAPTSGTLSASPASVTLGVSASGGSPSGSFTLTANGGPVSYTVTVPAQYAAELIVSPSSGSLATGASVTISVTWQSSAALQTALSIGPGGQAVSVSYQPLTGAPGAARRK